MVSFFLLVQTGLIFSQGFDRAPTLAEINYSPAGNQVTASNPPAFIWLPVEGADLHIMQYSRTRSFRPARTTTVRNLDMTVHVPAEVMEPGVWYWRYGYNDGREDHFSRSYRFEIPESAVHFPLVSAEEFISKIPKQRPRLYFSPDLVREIRSDKDGQYSGLTRPVIAEAEMILAMNEPLFEEPEPWPEQDYEDLYNKAWRSMRPYTQRMLTSAMAYLYTGDRRFAMEARRRLMHFMTWEVEGSSSTIWPTELGMDIAENTPPVFDWIYDILSEDERELCKEVLTARMVQINRDVHRSRNMESRPFSSHPGRMVGFAIEGGIVLAHESPEAKDWLDYTLRLLWSTYPAWGGDEGGWHEGISYWSSYMRRMTRIVHELDYYGIPLKNKPFFQNTGYYGLYAAYPHRPTGSFGDGAQTPPGVAAGLITYILSNLYDNPYFRWHAEEISALPSGRKAARIFNPHLEARPPDDLPQSRVFYDVGLVAMHSKMAEPDNNVMMLFKSNPFGAISHNHASQNAFIIEAFKEPLAISSGYYRSYGSPHHRNWVWETKAHNSILVDNEGQVPRQRSSRGEIIQYRENENFVYTAGDATEAYGGRLEKFHRHVIFVRPGYFVIIDDLKSSGRESTYQWLLHAMNEMQVDQTSNVVISTSGDARLTARFLTPGDLEFRQHTGFDPAVIDAISAPDQFHLVASTKDPAVSQRFVTVMWIDRVDESIGLPSFRDLQRTGGAPLKMLEIRDINDSHVKKVMQNAELIDARGGIALRVGDDLILWKESGAGRVRAAGISSKEPVEVMEGYFR
jgi:hypothetical protein